jgi:hypothetical protein
MSDTHEHVWTEGWRRGAKIYRACACGVYENPWTPDNDMIVQYRTENPFDWRGNDKPLV